MCKQTLMLLGLAGVVAACAGAQGRDEPATGYGRPPGPRGFDLEVLVVGRPLEREYRDGRPVLRAVEGADYELRITNPLDERVAVALSVDGLNTVDGRTTGAWDAGKWLVRPHQTLTVSGWQTSSERARRFYFTREADSYAARLGRPAEFGVIRAVFFRERRSPVVVAPRPRFGAESPATSARPGSSGGDGVGGAARRPDGRPWYEPGRAATGLGRPERSEVDVVDLALEREPVAEVSVRYAYGHRPSYPRPEPWPRPVPLPRPEDPRFCPEPAR